MGCDIHMFKEKLVDGKWVSLDKWVTEEGDDYPHVEPSLFDENRCYAFFGALAGVRMESRVHYSHFPCDVSEKVMIHYVRYWGTDAHSAGYITKAQATKLLQSPKARPCPTCGHSEMGMSACLPPRVVDYFQNIIDNLEDDERCVFWFDN